MTRKNENMKSLRVAEGSALQRLTAGKPFTETVHRMAELFEDMLEGNWVKVEPPMDEPFTGIAVEGEVYIDRASVSTTHGQLHEIKAGVEERIVTTDEALQLARDQYPAGLVPVLDDGEGRPLPVGYFRDAVDEEDDADLSHLA